MSIRSGLEKTYTVLMRFLTCQLIMKFTCVLIDITTPANLNTKRVLKYRVFQSNLYHCSCELRMPPAILVNKGCCSHQAITLQPPGPWALRELRMETPEFQTTSPKPSNHHQTHLRVRKHGILAPGSWGTDQRNKLEELRGLHLPIHRKALNSLTWEILFSLVN